MADKKYYDDSSKDLLEQFLSQLNTAGIEQDPELASADLKYIRSLQRNRLEQYQAQIRYTYKTIANTKGLAWKLDSDTDYVTRIPFSQVDTTIEYQCGKSKKRVREKQAFYSYIVWLKNQKKVNMSKAYTCPNCGAVSTIEELTKGCPYCRTRFLMSELYPKITEYFTLLSSHAMLKPSPYVVAGAVLAVIYELIAFFTNHTGNLALETIIKEILKILGFAVSGALAGFFLFIAGILLTALVKLVIGIPKLKKNEIHQENYACIYQKI